MPKRVDYYLRSSGRLHAKAALLDICIVAFEKDEQRLAACCKVRCRDVQVLTDRMTICDAQLRQWALYEATEVCDRDRRHVFSL